MARTRASDYDEKRRIILDRSAELFAAHGYDRASMSRIAEACGVSKANLYHYYRDKDEILFDVLRLHLEALRAAVGAADEPGLAAEPRLRRLVGALLEAYRGADARHKVQINDLALLPPDRQEALRAIERDLVRLFADAITGIAPQLKGTRLLTPVTMSFFGMVNWHYPWFRETGGLTRADYADLVTRLVVDGTARLAPAQSARPGQRAVG
ncbi:TetR/AcrR family transcriptional regulator [Methylobacterium nodulans]|uniref:Transcriptional regulator, TetR family n=1 Tax=Methylobacterium nodulans (strain LMG 21967 / CNCM I-2342 / ORS 2060) TaxID=460265 RepID=B8IP51_METNO|nr:TetR/AcrR family transcriptional regulator [Methylobacterium nodulans]ACL60369.1 transcriptional regulator, TetR family [Methylobacterium nodulans ORS 2060]